LMEDHPDRLSLRAQLASCRSTAALKMWSPPDPRSLALLLAHDRRRIVRSSRELAGVVMNVLADIQGRLDSHCELLWNEAPGRSHTEAIWRPKLESALSAYI